MFSGQRSNGLLGLDLVERLQRDLAEYRRKAARAAMPNQKRSPRASDRQKTTRSSTR